MSRVMKRGIRGGALFPLGWLEHTSATPALASKEIEHAYVELDRIQNENSRVRQERDEMRRGVEQWEMTFQSVEAELDNERRAVRSSKAARAEAERLLDKYRELSDKEAKKAEDVKCALSKEKDRAATLERRVRKLERAVFKARAQHNAGSLVSAIAKLAASPAVGKRLAAACHPDRVPAEHNDVAVELFKFVQNARDLNAS